MDRLGGLSGERRRQELLDADAIIAPLIGHSTCPWYRLPYGDGDRRVVDDVAGLGYTQQVGWTIDTLGWRGAPVQDIVGRSLRLAAPNAVYVMHVGSQSRDGPAPARDHRGTGGNGVWVRHGRGAEQPYGNEFN